MSERYQGISSVAFGQTDLPLALSVRLTRQGQAEPAGGDGDFFATSVQLARPAVAAEVRLRDTAVAEDLALGAQGDLSFVVGATQDEASARLITLAGAVLVAVELNYEQNSSAVAVLKFQAEAPDGAADPFAAQEAP